jgi:hypothetical protein
MGGERVTLGETSGCSGGPRVPVFERGSGNVMTISKADHATARFTERMVTEPEKVSGAQAHITSIKASANWAAATAVQTATNAWATETTAVDTTAQLIASLEKQIGVARANQLVNLRRWSQQRQATLSAIDVFCDGSKDTMLTFGVAVAAPTAHEPASTPVGLISRKDKVSRAVAWQWFLTPANRYGFMVQHATNVADATTYSQPTSCSKRSFKLLSQTPGTTISLRVMALDPALPTGQTDWSAWVPIMVPA